MIPLTRPSLPPLEEYVEVLRGVWESRMLSNFATQSQNLEALTTSYLEVEHARAVASGDVGLMITLAALQLPEGSPCFVPSFTFNSTVNAAIWNRLEPRFVDIDPATLTMSPDSLRAAMDTDHRPGVILATHVFGNPCDVGALTGLARTRGHYLVFDAAHGFGSLYQGAHVGTFGDAEVFSLSGTKLVTSAEGGLVTTRHGWLADRIDHLRNYGFVGDYNSVYVGMNGKLSELHAALGVLNAARTEEVVAERHAIVNRYREILGSHVGWQAIGRGNRSTYKDVAVLLGEDRPEVESRLAEHGVQTKRYFRPLHRMPAYEKFDGLAVPVTEAVYESVLCLPAFSGLTADDIDLVCGIILETCGSRRVATAAQVSR